MSNWPNILLEFWTATASHLWQSTIVMAVLGLLALSLRNAPGKIRNGLWTIALIKLAIPFSAISWIYHQSGFAMPLWQPGLDTTSESVTVSAVYGIWNPVILSRSPEGTALLLALWTAAWVSMVLWLMRRGIAAWLNDRTEYPIAASQLDPAIRKRLVAALRSTGIDSRHIQLSRDTRPPGVTGFFRPRIQLSEGLLRSLSSDALQAVLLHEEAHRRRYDPLRYGVQRLLFCLFFYFPPLWLLLRQLHDTAELACDEAALDQGTRPAAYLATLRKVVALDLAPATTLAAMAGARPSSFARRLSNINTYQRRPVMLRHRIALLAAIAVLSASVFVAGTPGTPKVPVPAGEDGVSTPIRTADSVAQPVYPETARKSRVSGTVVLQAVIQADGAIDELTVLTEDPKEYGFGDSAMEAVRQWRYEPALKEGKPVAVYLSIKVVFRLDGDKPKEEPTVS